MTKEDKSATDAPKLEEVSDKDLDSASGGVAASKFKDVMITSYNTTESTGISTTSGDKYKTSGDT